MARGTQSVENAVALRIPTKGRLLVAVSGGVDSVVLLHALVRRMKRSALCLHVAHVDHALRRESRADCAFVEELATRYSLPFYSIRLEPCPERENFEGWARVKRLQFFTELLETHGLHATVTAHHANDVAETLLMKLIANKQLTSIRMQRGDMALLRPLIDVKRETIERYAAKYRLTWREDRSNLDQKYLRNKVRHSLLPYLGKHFDPRIVEQLARAANRIDGDAEALEHIARLQCARFEKLRWGDRGWLRQLKSCLRIQPLAVGLRMLDQLLGKEMGRRFGWEHLERVREFLLHRGGAVELPDGFTLHMSGGRLQISKLDGRRPKRRLQVVAKVV